MQPHILQALHQPGEPRSPDLPLLLPLKSPPFSVVNQNSLYPVRIYRKPLKDNGIKHVFSRKNEGIYAFTPYFSLEKLLKRLIICIIFSSLNVENKPKLKIQLIYFKNTEFTLFILSAPRYKLSAKRDLCSPSQEIPWSLYKTLLLCPPGSRAFWLLGFLLS